MPFIPHTKEDTDYMLKAIGASNISSLFDEIPASIPKADLSGIPSGLSEQEVSRLVFGLTPNYAPGGCFIGAGAYEHHIPAAVWEITTRGEFYTAYTPYQAEASQGALQVIYEYQTIMSTLMGLDVSNASQYDGSSALVESVLMAIRIKKRNNKRVVVPKTVHPLYREVLYSTLKQQGVDIEEVDYCRKTGKVDVISLENAVKIKGGVAAVVIPSPNFFGIIEDVDRLTNIAHHNNALAVAVVNPIAVALLKEPGSWGEKGADIACGEGQPMGIPMASGGPYCGFLTAKQAFLRNIPGRIVGKSKDINGKIGFTLTLQAREQHIRRERAISNICTNQGLAVVASTIFASLMGQKGLKAIANSSHTNTRSLVDSLVEIDGVERIFDSHFFHECVIKLDCLPEVVMKKLEERGIQGGFSLGEYYPELENSILVCATETKTAQDISNYKVALQSIIKELKSC